MYNKAKGKIYFCIGKAHTHAAYGTISQVASPSTSGGNIPRKKSTSRTQRTSSQQDALKTTQALKETWMVHPRRKPGKATGKNRNNALRERQHDFPSHKGMGKSIRNNWSMLTTLDCSTEQPLRALQNNKNLDKELMHDCIKHSSVCLSS